MMRTALFTGAGASRAIGYPLTCDILPRVRTKLETGKLFNSENSSKRNKKDRDELRKYLLSLLPGFDDVTNKQLPLITDVFSLVEYAIVSGEALSIGGDNALRQCRDLLKYAITDIILDDFENDWDESDEAQMQEKQVLSQLTGWIEQQGESIGLVTTNYDIGIEYELYQRMSSEQLHKTLDLGFDWRDPGNNDICIERTRPSQPKLRVYKLHGSLDLLRCRSCGYVYFNQKGTIAHQAFRVKLDDNNTCHCREDMRLDLHIVAPSLVREVRDANLLCVWRSALEYMRNAERWIIAGYSLPPEDLAVRSLLLRAYTTAHQGKKPKITVVQRGEAELSRYKLFFPDCEYVTDGLEGFLSRQ